MSLSVSTRSNIWGVFLFLALVAVNTCWAIKLSRRVSWRQSATLGYDHGHRNRDHGGHPLPRRPRRHDDEDVIWRCCRLDIVVTTSLQCSRQPPSVVWVLGRCRRRRWQTTRTTSVVGRPTLSSFAVCRHSRNPSSCMRLRDYDAHVPACVSWSTLCPGVRIWLFMYNVCPGNFVTFVPAWVSRPPVCHLLPVPWVWK